MGDGRRASNFRLINLPGLDFLQNLNILTSAWLHPADDENKK